MNNLKEHLKEIGEDVYSHATKYGYFEIFNTHSKNLKEEVGNKKAKIDNKISFPIVETILVDNGQYSLWFFTEAERGLVLKKSSKKLSKEYILGYMIKQVIINLKTFYAKKIDKKEKEILNDLNNYIIFSEQKYTSSGYSGEYKYLEDINRVEFIYLKCHDNVDYFFNVLDFIKFINDTNKFGSLILIQFLININLSCKPLTVHFTKKDVISPKRYNIYTVKPKPDIIKSASGNKEDKDEEETRKKKDDYFDNLILLNNTVLLEELENKCEIFIKFIEKQLNVNIVDFVVKFMKSNDKSYYFVWGERLKYKKKCSVVKQDNPAISSPNFPNLNHKFKSSHHSHNSCFGDFCEFIVPRFFKNLKKNQNAEEYNKNNRDTRDKLRSPELPNLVPVIMVKRAYDNPPLVDLVLKAYSILPPGFENDKNTEGKKTLLYIPAKDKFTVLNPDFLYSKRFVCNNCYVIYLLIHNFLSNIDEKTSSFKSLAKAKNILMQGDKLKNPLLNDDSFEQHQQGNLVFTEEKSNFTFKKILKNQKARKNKSNSKPKTYRAEMKKKLTSVVTAKEKNNKIFSYKINVNSKVLKYNLVAEKSNNKFFNLILNKITVDNDNIYNKLGIKQPSKHSLKSMTNLRLHMGLNTHSNQFNIKIKQVLDERTSINKVKRSAIDCLDKGDQLEDIDIFIMYKHLKKQGATTGKYHKNEINIKHHVENNFLKNTNNNSQIVGDLSKISELGKGEINSEDNSDDLINHDKSDSSDQSSLGNSVLKEFKEKKGYRSEEKKDNVQELKLKIKSFDESSEEEAEEEMKNKERLHRLKHEKRCLSSISLSFSRDFIKDCLLERLIINENINQSFIGKRNKLEDISKEERLENCKQNKKIIHIHKPKTHRGQEISKKINVTSIFYYEWSRDSLKNVVPYYYISTPLTKFNEINIPVQENPYILCKSMNLEEFLQIGKFDYDPTIDSCKVFVYDQYTAIPYIVQDFSSNTKKSGKRRESLVRHLIRTETTSVSPEKHIKKNRESIKESKNNILVIVLNDFFDSFNKYYDTLVDSLSGFGNSIEKLKLICFNFPGQAMTIFPRKTTFNNLYFSEFLDRFFFNLVENNVFDHSYTVIMVGFGNGGQIALTFASCYEKYWDFIHSIILFNCYTENDDFVNKSMLEILKIVETSKNPKLVDFFYKSITVNPQKLLDLEVKNNIEMTSKEITDHDKVGDRFNPNSMTMNGYYNITKGFFFNIKINHGDIKTPLIVVHSNQNCFITINNINSLFKHMKNNPNENNQTNSLIKKNSNQYNYEELNPQNQVRRKFVVIDGSHDIIVEDHNYVSSVISSYLRYIIKNNETASKMF